jgi:predicted nuclease with RNAse H fold
MKTLGIDLSSQDANTAICVLRWAAGGCTIERQQTNVGNDEIVALMRDATASGIDAPFGWPVRFVAALTGWSSENHWTEPWDQPTQRQLRLRATDHWIHDQIFKWPMSVSADSIAMCAMRAAALLSRAVQPGNAIDRVDGPHFEVYPGAALIHWGLAEVAAGYKSEPEPRRALVDQLERQCTWLTIDASHRRQLAKSDHATDAFICSLIARAAAEGTTVDPPSDLDRDVLAREGWIRLPERDCLAGLAD